MIRRNHIDNGSKVGREVIRSRPHFNANPLNTHSPISSEPSENRMRLTSNHKKYYQYKEEREGRTRPFQQPEVSEQEERLPLADLPINREARADHQLRREYAYELDDTLKIDYNSISLKTNEQRRTAHIAHQPQSHSHHIAAPQPSSRKESPFPANSASFMPLFEETTVAMKRRELQESRCGLGRIYQTSSNKAVKTEYEGGREGGRSHQRRQSISDYTYMPGKPECISQMALPKESPSLSGSLQKEEVSQKLRMISQFNDQINERIKNIIGCFEGLKNKL